MSRLLYHSIHRCIRTDVILHDAECSCGNCDGSGKPPGAVITTTYPVVSNAELAKMGEAKCAWYNNWWMPNETPQFKAWWDSWYSHRKEEPVMPDDYYMKKAFALAGWLGSRVEENKENPHGQGKHE